MKNRLAPAALAIAIALSVVHPRQALAWGNAGHEAVAYVAWQQMTPATRARVIALLKQVPTLHNPANTESIPGYAEWIQAMPAGLSQDQQDLYLFMVAATWPDSIKHKWLHDSDTPPKGLTTDVNIGYTDTASHGYWHFIDTGFASDKSAVPATPVPNVATQIAALRTFIASDEDDSLKSYDLVWLEHLVGDIHQPLHAAVRYNAGKGDAGGNDVAIKLPAAMKKQFEGALSKSAPTELHAFWDDLPGEGEPSPALPEAAAFGKALPAGTGKTTDTDPADWAAESLAMAKKDAYVAPIGAAPSPSSGTAYLITTAYYNKALPDAQARIALAGARLAMLLNDNLK
jgi:S1/P1 Nuclease